MENMRNIGFTAADILDAGGDYLAARLGVRSGMRHPIAEQMIENDVTLAEMAAVLGEVECKRRGIPFGRIQAIGAALSTSDLANLLAESVGRLVFSIYGTESDHRRIAADTPVRDFRPVDFPLFDFKDELPRLSENTPASKAHVTTAAGESAQLSSWGVRLAVSRTLFINDSLDLMATVAARLASSATRLEAKQIYGVLEANSTLADGGAMFSAGAGNLVTGSPFSVEAIGKAMAALRRQPTLSGDESNAAPAYLLVPAELEAEALIHVRSMTTERAPLQVIATPWIAAGGFYVMADPLRSPVVGLLRLRGSKSPVRVEPARRRAEEDGAALGIVTDVGATALGRIGAVKVQTV